MKRWRSDERGEITIVGYTVIAVILFVGPVIIVGVGSLFDDDKPAGGGGAAAIESTIVAGPAPPANDCARDAYETFGLRWGPGWTVPGVDVPPPGSGNQEIRNYRAIITARVVDARALWMERGCHNIRSGEGATPDPVVSTSPTATLTLDIRGTYVLTEDEARRSTGAAAVDDPLGCAARRVPTEMTVSSVSSSTISVSYADTPGSPAFSTGGTFDPSTSRFAIPYPDVSGNQMEGSFSLFGDKVLLSDGKFYSGDCTFFFQGEKK